MNELRDQVFANGQQKGFWDKERNMGEALMLIVTELAEAMEVHRASGTIVVPSESYKKLVEQLSDDEFPQIFKDSVKDTFPDEMADAIIRILDLCGGNNIDIDWHIKMKMRYNATRERLHGKTY